MARLAILLPDLRGGGAERVALTLAEGFLHRGHQVDVIVLRAAGELLTLLPAGVRLFDLRVGKMRRSIWPLASYLRRERPGALLAFMWPLTAIAVVSNLLARNRTRIATSDHGLLSEHYGAKPLTLAALRLTARLFYPCANARLAPSRAIAADLENLSGLPAGSIEAVGNPVPPHAGTIPSADDIQRLWGDAEIRILSVGALKPEKDHQLLVRAFAAFAPAHNARLVILGEGGMRPDLEALAGQLGISDQVDMPGFCIDPSPYFASATLFVLTSQSEGFGNVLVEALAAGLPVVSTDCPGPREILENGKWGRLVPVGDSQALAHAMQDSLKVGVDRQKLMARAAEFAPDRITNAYLHRMLETPSRGLARDP